MGIQLTGLASGLDTASIVSDLMEIEYTKVESLEKEKTLVEWEQEAWSDVNTKLYSFYTDELFDLKSYGTYSQKNLTSSNQGVANLTNASSDITGSFSIDVSAIASSAFITGDQLTYGADSELADENTTAATVLSLGETDISTISITVGTGDDAATYDIDIEATDTMDDIAQKIEDLDIGVKADFDGNFNRFFISSEETGAASSIQFSETTAGTLASLGLSTDQAVGEDAVFEYNGTELTSSTNEISINGLQFDIQGVGSSTLTVSQDTEAIYESVKAFVTKYNELMEEFNDLLDASYVLDDYQPLTDDEKDAMSDDEIEDWEALIKGSLLRNDDILTSVVRSMRSTMTTSTGVDTSGFTYKSLSELGIMTGDYSEKGQLHIYGDDDDSTFSAQDNTLMQKIKEDPEGVTELLTALGQQLYTSFSEKMKSSSISSALTFYNNKRMDSDVEDYEDRIDDLEDRMEIIEERYYSQFTAMEQAMQQANSTSEWLSQQLASL